MKAPLFLAVAMVAQAAAALVNQPPDPSADFSTLSATYFFPGDLIGFDPSSGAGKLRWQRTRPDVGHLFDHMVPAHRDVPGNEWPKGVYAENPELPFRVDFISPNTVRLRFESSATARPAKPSIMLAAEAAGGKLPADTSWKQGKVDGGWRFTGAAGSVVIKEKPWSVEVLDPDGRTLTRSVLGRDPQPFCFIRRDSDYSRSFSAAFSLAPGEKLFGCGESFTGFDKRGQKLLLSTTDALGTEKPAMYKPVPFYLSSAGYGIFLHTSAPVTFDLGSTNYSRATLSTTDDALDVFIFLGDPKAVLGAYTALTGRASMPPLWSFGLWMSRITYKSEQETREVAGKLRENKIPCDVIHLDTGWFETDWQCDYKFSQTRFADPKKMIGDLAADGFHVCLWQLPYFVPQNALFPEILQKDLAVHDAKGNTPGEDAILDFSNPETAAWYQGKLEGLLRLGVGAIKTDFGEAAPLSGLYASGRTGLYEHNLYPLRYQQAAADVIRKINGDSVIWARAGWAGAQRNPVHWGGDAGKTFGAMAGTLRAGLSIGLSGFSFWSHDIGGFGGRNNLDVYRAWLPFGMLTSHSRVHGEPPKEPWLLDQGFMDDFRRADEMRYRLMPYIYAQAKDSSERGLPMIRALFVEYPDDPGAWSVDDQYLFGQDLLVAPLFSADSRTRNVYLPGAAPWIDYQTGKTYAPGWQKIEAGQIPAVILARGGSAIPHAQLAQSTKDIDWTNLELRVFADPGKPATGLACLPADKKLVPLEVDAQGKIAGAGGNIRWTISRPSR